MRYPRLAQNETPLLAADPNDVVDYDMQTGFGLDGKPLFTPARMRRIVAADRRYLQPTVTLYRLGADGKTVERLTVNGTTQIERRIEGTPNFETVTVPADLSAYLDQGWSKTEPAPAAAAKAK